MKKIVLLILSCCVVGSAYAADTKKYLYETPMVMSGSTEGYLANMPEDVQRIIVTLVAQAGSADEAADAIRALMDTNKQFFNIINTQEAMTVVINLIARKFNGNHENIARRIHTKVAQEYAKKSKQSLHKWDTIKSAADGWKLIKDGADITFIDKDGQSPLVKIVEAARKEHMSTGNVEDFVGLVKYCVQNGASVDDVSGKELLGSVEFLS